MKSIKMVTPLVNTSALGDTIALMPIVSLLLKHNRINKILIPNHWTELFRLFEIDSDKIVVMKEDGLTPFDPGDSIMIPFYSKDRAPYRIHLTYHFGESFSFFPKEDELDYRLPMYRDESRVPSKPNDLPSEYFVLQSSTRRLSRTLPAKDWNRLKSKLLKKHPVVLIGKHLEAGYDSTGCITDYMNEDLATAALVCNYAKRVISMDGGLIYIAALTNVNILGIYTFVDPYYRAPYRKGIKGWNFESIAPSRGCSFCSNMPCAFGVEFDVNCPYNLNYECRSNIDIDKIG